MRHPDRRRAPDRGAVTAELALGLPIMLSVTVGLVWLLSVAAAQMRTVDAARESARALARGDDPAAAVAVGASVAPQGARVVPTITGDQAQVVVTARVGGPGGLLGFLPSVTLHAEAHAVVEPAGDTVPGPGAGP